MYIINIDKFTVITESSYKSELLRQETAADLWLRLKIFDARCVLVIVGQWFYLPIKKLDPLLKLFPKIRRETMQQPSNCNSSGSNNSSISNTATNISNNSYHYSTTLNTNHDSSFSSLVRKYKSRSSLTTNSIASNCNIPLTLQSLPGVNSNPHHPSPLNSNSTFTPTTLPPPSLTTDTSLFLSHGIHGGALGHQSELSTPPGISGGLSSLAHHPLNNPLAASAAPVDILAPASSLVTASPLVSASAFGGPNGGLGSGVTGGCDSPTSGGAASVAAAAAYAYRNTPYYYFYPGIWILKIKAIFIVMN